MKTASLATDANNKRKILRQFDKTEKDLEYDVEIIRNWAKTQHHLPEVPSDTMIEFFVVNNKFNMEVTKQKLDMYYTIRHIMPELYGMINPRLPAMQKAFDHTYIIPLPKLVEGMYRVEIVKLREIPFEDMDVMAILGKAFNVSDVRIQEADLMFGDMTIYDFEHLKMAHVLRFTPMHMKILATIFEKVFSNRIKGIHIINHPPIFHIVMKLAKSVTKPKLFERIHLHDSTESLSRFLPLDVLPKDYGGNELSLAELHEQWRIKFEEHQDHFDRLDRLKVNEALRPTPLKYCDHFGVAGTFKKINID